MSERLGDSKPPERVWLVKMGDGYRQWMADDPKLHAEFRKHGWHGPYIPEAALDEALDAIEALKRYEPMAWPNAIALLAKHGRGDG